MESEHVLLQNLLRYEEEFCKAKGEEVLMNWCPQQHPSSSSANRRGCPPPRQHGEKGISPASIQEGWVGQSGRYELSSMTHRGFVGPIPGIPSGAAPNNPYSFLPRHSLASLGSRGGRGLG